MSLYIIRTVEMQGTDSALLYDTINEVRKNDPYMYDCWVSDGAQNAVRAAVLLPDHDNPYAEEGELQFEPGVNQYIGGYLISLTLEIMEADLSYQSELLEEHQELRQKIQDEFSPTAQDKLCHFMNERRPTFYLVYEIYENVDFDWHICTLQDVCEEIDTELQYNWQAVVANADLDRVNRFESLPMRGHSEEAVKDEFKDAMEALTLMGNCVDYPLYDAVKYGISHIEQFQGNLEQILV